jgi:ornithine cyclodeaminase/alanine dehydrogenase-like protein (mu-crystallin family)
MPSMPAPSAAWRACQPGRGRGRAQAGRESESETILFDSTGVALSDVAAAALIYERAVANGHRTSVQLTA